MSHESTSTTDVAFMATDNSNNVESVLTRLSRLSNHVYGYVIEELQPTLLG